MCHIFAGQPRENYAKQNRSMRLNGYSTSVSLEACFWRLLEEISSAQDMSLAEFITALYDEALEIHGNVDNFTSLLRCACLTYVSQFAGSKKELQQARLH